MLPKWIHLQRRVKEATFRSDTDRQRCLKAYQTMDVNLGDNIIDIGEVCFGGKIDSHRYLLYADQTLNISSASSVINVCMNTLQLVLHNCQATSRHGEELGNTNYRIVLIMAGCFPWI